MESNFMTEVQEILELTGFNEEKLNSCMFLAEELNNGLMLITSYDPNKIDGNLINAAINDVDTLKSTLKQNIDAFIYNVEDPRLKLTYEVKEELKNLCKEYQELAEGKLESDKKILEQKLLEVGQAEKPVMDSPDNESKTTDSNEDKSVENEKNNKEKRPQQLSRGLKKVLSKDAQNAINGLFNFSEKMDALLTDSKCTPEEREVIANKLEALLYYVREISELSRKPGLRLEEKKRRLREMLGGYNDIIGDITKEMQEVEELLKQKVKESTVELGKEYDEVKGNFDKLIDGNIAIEDEKAKDAKGKVEEAKGERDTLEKEKKEKEGKKEKEETQMVEYKGNGFWDKFHRIRAEGKKENGKKPGIIRTALAVFREFKEEREALEQGVRENPEIKAIEEKIQECDSKIEAAEQTEKDARASKKALEEQRDSLIKDYDDAYEMAVSEAMEKAKEVLDESKQPIQEEEITEERVGGLLDRIKAFRDNVRTSFFERRVGKLNEKIAKISAEYHTLQEQREREGTSDELEADIAYDVKLINKNQMKRYNLLQKHNERNSGQDR